MLSTAEKEERFQAKSVFDGMLMRVSANCSLQFGLHYDRERDKDIGVYKKSENIEKDYIPG